jgi:hypothetical protein
MTEYSACLSVPVPQLILSIIFRLKMRRESHLALTLKACVHLQLDHSSGNAAVSLRIWYFAAQVRGLAAAHCPGYVAVDNGKFPGAPPDPEARYA